MNMRARVRLALAGALVIAGCVAGAGGADAAPAGVPQATAVQEFGACLAGGKPGDLLLLMDQSGSLGGTDPTAVRVTAAQRLMSQLANSPTAKNTELDVAISGFDATYQKLQDWQRLTPQSVDGVNEAIGQFGNRNTGLDTDYVNGLNGARDELRARARSGDRCQAILWFTDGQFDIGPRVNADQQKQYGTSKPYAPGASLTDPAGTKQARADGQQSLCREGGVADQLRSSNVLTFGIALGSSNPPGGFGLMKSIATGTGDGSERCGRPTDHAVGDFRLATDIDDLLFAFDSLSDPGQTPLDQQTGVCAGQPCDEAHTFVLDDSVRSVHVLAGASEPGVQVHLTAPDSAQSTTFGYTGNGTEQVVQLGGQDVHARWLTDRTLDLTLDHRGPGWVGQWAVVFVDPSSRNNGAQAKTQIRISGDLVPALDGAAPTLRSGEQPGLRIALRSESTNQPVPVDSIRGTASVSAQLLPSAGGPVAIANDRDVQQLSGPVTANLTGVAPGSATLRLTLKLRTADAGPGKPGTPLDPRVVDVPVTVLPPLNYPTVADRVDLGTAQGTKPLTGNLAVTGPGCVWIDGSSVDAAPDGVGAVAVSAPSHATKESCQHVDGGSQAAIPLQLTVQKAGNGTVGGTLTAHLLPQGQGQPLSVPVRFVGDISKARSALFLPEFLAALLIGIALPIGGLYLAKRWASRIPAAPLLVGTVTATVQNGHVTRNGSPFTVSDEDVQFVSVPAPTRSLSLPTGQVLEARTGGSPSAVGYALLLTPLRPLVGSGTPGAPDRLPLANRDTWVVLVPEHPSDRFEVVLLLGADADAELFRRVGDEIRSGLPRLLQQADVQSGPGAASAGGPTSPFAGGGFAPQPSASWSPFRPDPSDSEPASSPTGGPFSPGQWS